MSTIRIRGRDYEVSVREKPDAQGRIVYYLRGKRGAHWFTVRNVNHPSLMFLVNGRNLGSSMLEGVWLDDASGELVVRSS